MTRRRLPMLPFVLALLLGLATWAASPAPPARPPARASSPTRSPTSAGPASCRSASAAARIANFGDQEDIDNPAARSAVAASIRPSGSPSASGSPHGTSKRCASPSASTSLGGIDLDPGHPGPRAARFTRSEGDGDGGSFYQAHFYVNPVMYWLEVVTDFPCLEKGSFRPGLPHRGRPALGRRRAHADPQPGRRAVRQSGRHRGLRGRLRGRLAGLRHPGDVLVRRLPGRPLSRSTAMCPTTWAACAPPP
jgi:hypothetical protein